jgi:hypothetical protein
MNGIALTSRNSRHHRSCGTRTINLSPNVSSSAYLPYTFQIRCKNKTVRLGGVTLKLLGYMLLLMGMGSAAFATAVPEINPASASSALALVSGALLVMRGRRKK